MAPPLRIGVFGARGIPSTYSGYETFLTVLLPELAARGHHVTMYCRRGDVADLASYEGVRCVQLPALASKQLSTLSHGLVAGAAAVMARHDVLLVVNVANAGACLVARALGQRIVLNTDGQEWARGKWGRVARRVFLVSAQVSRWSAGALVADSQEMQRIYRERFRAASTVIPYCWTGLTPAPDDGALTDLGLRPREYLLVAGRLVPENNMVEIATAFASLDQPRPLVVLGRANYDSPVQRTLDDLSRRDPRVVVAGHVEDRARYAALVAGARVYIHGHSVGGLNPSLIEAMGLGARVVALDTPFNREALGDTGNYFSSPSGDLTGVLRAVLAEPPEAAERVRAAASRRARERFALADVADAYEDLLRAVAGAPVWSGRGTDTQW